LVFSSDQVHFYCLSKMKILGFILLTLICLLQFRIWLGESGYQKIESLNVKITEQLELNKKLEAQNKLLKKEILALRKNPALLEEKAREQLGLVKPNEIFYRIIPKVDNKP
jgi:cell division protein FtsB